MNSKPKIPTKTLCSSNLSDCLPARKGEVVFFMSIHLSVLKGCRQNTDLLLTPSKIHWENEKNKSQEKYNERLNQVHK